MSYNISNSGKTISTTPFAHYRFDNLDTNLIGTTVSAFDDHSGNGRALSGNDVLAHPLVSTAGWSVLPDDMTCLFFDGETRRHLRYVIPDSDTWDSRDEGVTIVAVVTPNETDAFTGGPGKSKSGILVSMEGKRYTNNNSNFAIINSSQNLQARCYYPGRVSMSSHSDPFPTSPCGYVLETNGFGGTHGYAEPSARAGAYTMAGFIQDWSLCHEHEDDTSYFNRKDLTIYKDYEFHSTSTRDPNFESIQIGDVISPTNASRHTSYKFTRGRLYEVFIFKGVLDSTDRNTLTRYIHDKYHINNNEVVNDQCVSLPYGKDLMIYNKDALSCSPKVLKNRHASDSITINAWIRFRGTRLNAPGAKYISNLKTGAKNNTIGTIFTESTALRDVSNTTYSARARIAGHLPSGKSISFYTGNLTNGTFNVLNHKWYHVKWVITDFKDGQLGYDTNHYAYRSMVYVNGKLLSSTKDGWNYRYLNPTKVIFGVGPETGSPGARRTTLNYIVPVAGYAAANPYESNTMHHDRGVAEQATELQFDVAGYNVVIDEYKDEMEVLSTPGNLNYARSAWPNYPEGGAVAAYLSAYEDHALSAAKIDHLIRNPKEKPSDTPDQTTTEPMIDDESRGGWQYIKAMYNPRPPLNVLGVEQWGSTSSLWNSNFNLKSRKLKNCDWFTYSTANRSFKNTGIDISSNQISDVSGMAGLYSITGPGGDVPTNSSYYLRMNGNRIETLAPWKNSTFTLNSRWRDVYLNSNRLTNLEGLQNFKYCNYVFSANDNLLENVDALAETNWVRYSSTNLHNNRINFTPGVYPFMNWTGYTSMNLSNNHISDIRFASCSAAESIGFYNQARPNLNPVDGVNFLWVPRASDLNFSGNKYTNTNLESIPTGAHPHPHPKLNNTNLNVVNRWNRLTQIHCNDTNIEDFSCLADLSMYNRSNAQDYITALYTGDGYGFNTPEFTYGDGFSARDIAPFTYLEFNWHPRIDELNVTDDYTQRFTNSTARTDGFTTAYNAGKRMYVNRKLQIAYAPIHDLRLFKYAFHGISSWYAPHVNHHYFEAHFTQMESGPNTTGVLKNWSKCNRFTLGYNKLTHLNDWFVDSGFYDTATETVDGVSVGPEHRGFWQKRKSFMNVYVEYNDINDISFMLKKNFAGVQYLRLTGNPVTYEMVDEIADDLIALKAAGEIDLQQVDMYYTTWDLEFIGGYYPWWDNPAYYRFDGTHAHYIPTTPTVWSRPDYSEKISLYTHPYSATGTDGPLYSKKSRAQGFQGHQYDLGYSPDALLRKKLLDAGINFRFNRDTSTWINGLGYSLTDFDRPSPDWDNAHKLYKNHYRWGHRDPSGRLVLTQTDSTENATNTISITFACQVDIYPGDTITLSRLYNLPMASSNSFPIRGTMSNVFGSTGVWDQTAGTLKITASPNQRMLHDQLYTLTFDITNPSYDDDITNGYSSRAGVAGNFKYASGRYVYVNAEDRLGVDRTDNRLPNAPIPIAPVTQ